MTRPARIIGTPVTPEHLYQTGIATCLDEMQSLAAVNTVLTYSMSIFARQYRGGRPATTASGQEISDIHVRIGDQAFRHGPLRVAKNPQALWADRDVLDELADAAASRSMQVYARILEPYVITGAIPGLAACAEIDVYGNPGADVCFNHPDYIGFWHDLITDLVEQHPRLGGFKFGQERGGAIGKALATRAPTCFCQHCIRKGEERGIRIDEARHGLIALHDYARARTGDPASAGDGHFVEFLRILARFPDLLSWERLWEDSREDQRRRMYQVIKRLRPTMQVGWHICHGMTFDVMARVTRPYQGMVAHSDWLSLALYFDCQGDRSLKHFNTAFRNRILGDAAPDLAWSIYQSWLGLDPHQQPSLTQHEAGHRAMHPAYVAAETRRAVNAVAGKVAIHPRIGFDVPMYQTPIEPADVEAATQAAITAGADGLWLGREYGELKKAHIAAFGRAVRAWR